MLGWVIYQVRLGYQVVIEVISGWVIYEAFHVNPPSAKFLARVQRAKM